MAQLLTSQSRNLSPRGGTPDAEMPWILAIMINKDHDQLLLINYGAIRYSFAQPPAGIRAPSGVTRRSFTRCGSRTALYPAGTHS
jgi:hypothetical protein